MARERSRGAPVRQPAELRRRGRGELLPRQQRPGDDVFGQVAGKLADLGGALEDRLDLIAAEEGAAEGRQAGQQQNLKLRDNLTIRARAFNKAAVETYRGRLEVDTTARMQEVYNRNSANPKALEGELAKLKGDIAGKVPAALRPEFEQGFDRSAGAYMDDARRQQERLVLDSRNAAVTEQLETRMQTIEREAFLSGDDQAAALRVTAELEDYTALLLEHGPQGEFEFQGQAVPADPTRSGLFSVTQIQEQATDAARAAAGMRVLGKFNRLRGVQQKQAFLEAFESDFESGRQNAVTASLTGRQASRLMTTMRSDIREAQALRAVQLRAVRDRADDVVEVMKDGFQPQVDVEGLKTEARALGDGKSVERLDDAQDLLIKQEALRKLRPEELGQHADDLRRAMNERGATPQLVDELEMTERLQQTVESDARSDPIALGGRVGLLEVEELDLFGEAGASAVQIDQRVAQAQEIAAYYGVPVKVLTETEARRFAAALDDETGTPDQQLAALAKVQAQWGDKYAPLVLDQLSDNSPVMGHIASLTAVNEEGIIIAERALKGRSLSRETRALLPDAADIDDITAEVIGDAFRNQPQAFGPTVETAKLLYVEANASAPGTFDEDIYRASLKQALGETSEGGGLGARDGHQVILPSRVREDRFMTAVDRLRDEDLVRLGGGEAPKYLDGNTATADEIIDHGRFDAVGDGVYRIFMSGGYLQGKGTDGFYELELTRQDVADVIAGRFAVPTAGGGAKAGPLPSSTRAPRGTRR